MCAEHSHSVKYIVEELFYTAIVPAVDCFVLASGFVMWNKSWKFSRLVGLWLQVVFYGLLVALVADLFCPWVDVNWKTYLVSALPISFNRLWFFTQYAALFMTMPILNLVMSEWSGKQIWRTALVGAALLSVIPSVVGRDVFVSHFGYSYLWFCYLYLVGASIAKYRVYERLSGIKAMALYLVCVPVAFACHVGQGLLIRRLGVNGEPALTSYSSPFILAEAVLLLLAFTKIRLQASYLCKLVGFVGPLVFSVYAIHSQSVLRMIVRWNGLYSPIGRLNIPLMLLSVVGCAIGIFAICVMIDAVRLRIFRFCGVDRFLRCVDERTAI